MARIKLGNRMFEFNTSKISPPPLTVPAQTAKDLRSPQARKEVIQRMLKTGTVFDPNTLSRLVANALTTSYYRRTFYRECEQAMGHPIVSGAIDLYVDSCTSVSSITNRSVWATCEGDKKLENILNQFLDEIAVEEKIRDWVGQLAGYGDFFLENIGRDGIGVAFVDDNIHPADMERVDVNGRLEGFMRTGLFASQPQVMTELEPPWQYVHFRTFGMTRKVLNTALGIFGEPGRMFSLESARTTDKQFRITTRYGVALLTPVIPVYKRLKLAEDSLLMSRMTRGILWYLYKIKVSGANPDMAAELVQDYAEYLKRNLAAGLDTTTGTKEWNDKWAMLFGQIEDLFVPETDDVSVNVEKLGGEPDIKAIVDIKYLMDQLLGSLRVSRMMLGMTDELPGGIGQSAAERISINYAKNAQRLQSATRAGIKRLAQIHLAYLGQNPDPSRFEINLTEISSAEEEEIKDALDKGVDIVDKIMDLFDKVAGESEGAGIKFGAQEKLELLDYLNQKILKLNDLDMEELLKKTVGASESKEKRIRRKESPQAMLDSDLFAYLPRKHTDDETKRINEAVEKAKQENAQVIIPFGVLHYRLDENKAVQKEIKEWTTTTVKIENKDAKNNGNAT